MISFELSNGDAYGRNVPVSIDDEEYVEYTLDNLADFPSSMEEEERVSTFNDFYSARNDLHCPFSTYAIVDPRFLAH